MSVTGERVVAAEAGAGCRASAAPATNAAPPAKRTSRLEEVEDEADDRSTTAFVEVLQLWGIWW